MFVPAMYMCINRQSVETTRFDVSASELDTLHCTDRATGLNMLRHPEYLARLVVKQQCKVGHANAQNRLCNSMMYCLSVAVMLDCS